MSWLAAVPNGLGKPGEMTFHLIQLRRCVWWPSTAISKSPSRWTTTATSMSPTRLTRKTTSTFHTRAYFLPDVDDLIETDKDVGDQHEADVASINEMMMIF